MWRKLIIRWVGSNAAPHEYVWEYDIKIYRDSEALHHALAQVDPGDDYLVRFMDMPPTSDKD